MQGTSLHGGFIHFFPLRILSTKVFLSASGSGLTKKMTQICLQIHFKIAFFNMNFGG